MNIFLSIYILTFVLGDQKSLLIEMVFWVPTTYHYVFVEKSYIYPTKKKRTTTIFPLSSPFNMKMLIVMKYLFLIKSY